MRRGMHSLGWQIHCAIAGMAMSRTFTTGSLFTKSSSAGLGAYYRVGLTCATGPAHVVSQPWDRTEPPREYLHLSVPWFDISVGPPHTYAAFSDAIQQNDIWIAPLDSPGAARPLVATRAAEAQPRVSQDGKWLAYTSNETGQPEVYVQSLSGLERRVHISSGGGSEPMWSAATLFYRGSAYMMRAELNTNGELRVTRRDTLFRDVYKRRNVVNYDIFPGGRELLMIRLGPTTLHEAIVLNWPELLRQRGSR